MVDAPGSAVARGGVRCGIQIVAAGAIRQRLVFRQESGRNGVDAGLRNPVVRKRIAGAGSLIQAERVENRDLAGEVAAPRGGVGHRARPGIPGLLPQPFIDPVEEGVLQFGNAAAQRSAELVLAEDGPRPCPVVEVIVGVAELVTPVLERASVEVLSARFGHHVDGAAARLRELRRREGRLDVEFPHRIQGRIDRDGKRVSVRIVGAVQQKRIHGGAAAVDGRVQGH